MKLNQQCNKQKNDNDMDNLSVRLTLGISACLLGKPVRFDGGHKKNNFILSSLSNHFDFMSLCP